MLTVDMEDAWIVDSGASRHVCFHREWFIEMRLCTNDRVSLSDNSTCEAKGVGTILIQKYVNGQWETGRIENVLYVPQLKRNLFSVGVCTSRGFQVKFTEHEVVIYGDNKVLAKGAKQHNGMYHMMFKVNYEHQVNVSSAENLQKWHERLAHMNINTIKKLSHNGTIKGINKAVYKWM